MLVKGSYLTTGLLVAMSSVACASSAIGTASARGDIRVDGYSVTGNATLFDGTAIQTNQATATLRLQKGTEIKLATDSMGTLFHDHMVLLHGKGELSTTSAFLMEASGFRVIPIGTDAHGVVTINSLGNIQVAALSGELQVVNGGGFVLGRVHSGTSMSFMLQASSTVTLTGELSKSDGHYFITNSNGVMTELTGKNMDHYVGKNVTVTGTTVNGVTPDDGATSVVKISSISKEAVIAGGGGGLLTGVLAGAAGGTLIWGVHEAATDRPSVSR